MFADHHTQICDVLGSTVTEGEVRLNIGDSTDGKGWGANIPLWGQHGFASRPADPSSAGNAMAIVLRDGHQQRVGWVRDNRFAPLVGTLKPGESMMFGPAGQFIRTHQDGSITLFTTDNGNTEGRSIYLMISPSEGFSFVCPWGRWTFGPNGIHLVHSSGARLDLGAIGGVPGLESLGSYAKLQGAMASVMGSVVSLGVDGGAANVASVTSLVTILSQLIHAISLITSATPGASALVTATLPADAATAVTAFTPLLGNIGKVA